LIQREISALVAKRATQLPVVAILGPRQSGKTTLARTLFNNHRYVSLEELDTQRFATEDPRRFLELYQNPHGIILDEFQRVPSLLSYIQTYVDTHDLKGYFILTGSQNFLMMEAVSQTLAGRVALCTLLPCSTSELSHANLLAPTLDEAILRGSYPRPLVHNLDPSDWCQDYIMTYLERDVRLVKNIIDLSTFKRFVQLCAGRVGQLLNLSSLATESGITVPTAKQWLSVLQASYLIFLVQPHFRNFNKRLVKTPKLYFYDTALLCTLLGIETASQLGTHYSRGSIVESYVMSDLYKQLLNRGRNNQLYFWRDSVGHEIDCILERADTLVPLEIKAGKTVVSDFFTGITFWQQLTGMRDAFVVYAGDQTQKREPATLVSWREIDTIIKQVFS